MICHYWDTYSVLILEKSTYQTDILESKGERNVCTFSIFLQKRRIKSQYMDEKITE